MDFNSIESIKNYLLKLQQAISEMVIFEETENHFKEDVWVHEEGGGGITRVIENGLVIEKGGVNFSHVKGIKLPPAATAKRPELANFTFQAMGVSVVLHPLNPYAPTAHFNVRFICVDQADAQVRWWIGGGFDLTPYYGFDEDCIHWHTMAKKACTPFGKDIYLNYKTACDQYFYLKHRNEPRGIGGLFFDDLNEWGFERCFEFMRSVGTYFILAYQPIIARRKDHFYTQRERDFQLYRRGRYVEFNLLYDRGTLFGLQSGGRVESILMSLPPAVKWQYNYSPQAGSEEAKLYQDYLKPKAWVSYD